MKNYRQQRNAERLHANGFDVVDDAGFQCRNLVISINDVPVIHADKPPKIQSLIFEALYKEDQCRKNQEKRERRLEQKLQQQQSPSRYDTQQSTPCSCCEDNKPSDFSTSYTACHEDALYDSDSSDFEDDKEREINNYGGGLWWVHSQKSFKINYSSYNGLSTRTKNTMTRCRKIFQKLDMLPYCDDLDSHRDTFAMTRNVSSKELFIPENGSSTQNSNIQSTPPVLHDLSSIKVYDAVDDSKTKSQPQHLPYILSQLLDYHRLRLWQRLNSKKNTKVDTDISSACVELAIDVCDYFQQTQNHTYQEGGTRNPDGSIDGVATLVYDIPTPDRNDDAFDDHDDHDDDDGDDDDEYFDACDTLKGDVNHSDGVSNVQPFISITTCTSPVTDYLSMSQESTKILENMAAVEPASSETVISCASTKDAPTMSTYNGTHHDTTDFAGIPDSLSSDSLPPLIFTVPPSTPDDSEDENCIYDLDTRLISKSPKMQSPSVFKINNCAADSLKLKPFNLKYSSELAAAEMLSTLYLDHARSFVGTDYTDAAHVPETLQYSSDNDDDDDYEDNGASDSSVELWDEVRPDYCECHSVEGRSDTPYNFTPIEEVDEEPEQKPLENVVV